MNRRMLTIARPFLIVAATATLYLGCSEATGNGSGDGTEADMIEATINNLSHVGAYYVAFLPDGLNPACEPPDSWIVYSLGEDYVGPSGEKSYLLEKPEGTFCSIFVGRNTFELSPIDKGWRWDQTYNGENLAFTLTHEDPAPPWSEMSMDDDGDRVRDYIDLDP